VWGLEFSQQCCWSFWFSRMLCCVGWQILTNISKDLSAFFLCWLTLEVGALGSLETSVTVYPSTWHNIPEDLDLHVCVLLCNFGFWDFATFCFATVPTLVTILWMNVACSPVYRYDIGCEGAVQNVVVSNTHGAS
jgi:hypothetical protein